MYIFLFFQCFSLFLIISSSFSTYFSFLVLKNILVLRKNENIKLRIKNRSYKSSQSLKDNFSILGHYHGVLWVNLPKLENLVHGPDGSLINGTEEQVKSEKWPVSFCPWMENGWIIMREDGSFRNEFPNEHIALKKYEEFKKIF